MKDLDKATKVFEAIKAKVEHHKFFSGIEIASLQKDNAYTDDLCVRVLVNEKNIDHKDLNLPQTMEDVPIEVTYRVIKAQDNDG